MLASNCRNTTDLRLLRMRRLAVRPSRRSPHVGFGMDFTISSSLLLNSLVLSHHQIESLSWITRCEGMYEEKICPIASDVRKIE